MTGSTNRTDSDMTHAPDTRTPLLFRYPGGKHYAMPILRPFWEAITHTEYREPFAGGATVFFNKPKVAHNWLNDADTELMTVYRCLANDSLRAQLVARLSVEEASPSRWQQIRRFEPKSELDVAFKYYYLNRTSFSGKLISPAWGYRPKRSLPPERWHERLIPCGEKLATTQLTTSDFQSVIETRSRRNVLMYVDPPYFLPPKYKHYRHGLDTGDHVRLAECLKQTSHSFFLTYDDATEIRALYSWAYVYPVQFIYRVENSATQRGVRRQGFELVITNFKVKGLEYI